MAAENVLSLHSRTLLKFVPMSLYNRRLAGIFVRESSSIGNFKAFDAVSTDHAPFALARLSKLHLSQV